MKIKLERVILNTISSLSGLHILLLMILMKEKCELHPLSNVEWLPHLSQSSRATIYAIYMCIIMTNTSIRSLSMLRFLMNKGEPMNYFEYYRTTKNRYYSQEEKYQLLSENCRRGNIFPVLEEASDIRVLYRSSCLFWFKENIRMLDKHLKFIVISIFAPCVAYFTPVLLFILYITFSPIKSGSPQVWQVAEDPYKFEVLYEEGLCLVETSILSRLFFSTITTIVIVDTVVYGIELLSKLTTQVYCVLKWIENIDATLVELKCRYTEELESSKVVTGIRRTRTILGLHRASSLSNNTDSLKFYPKRDLMSFLSKPNTRYHQTVDFFHRFNIDEFDGEEDCESNRHNYHTELLHLAAKNDIIALLMSINDTDLYIRLVNFASSFAVFVVLTLVVLFWHRTDTSGETTANVCLCAFYCSAALMNHGFCSIANSRMIKLHRRILSLIPLLPPSSRSRRFWTSISQFCFNKSGLYAYTILGLVNNSWLRYFKVSSPDIRIYNI